MQIKMVTSNVFLKNAKTARILFHIALYLDRSCILAQELWPKNNIFPKNHNDQTQLLLMQNVIQVLV